MKNNTCFTRGLGSSATCMLNRVQIGDKALPLPANTLYSNHMRPYAQYPKYPTVAHPSAIHRIVRAHHDPRYPQTS